MSWSQIEAESRRRVRVRLPLHLAGAVVGSVAVDQLPLLQALPADLRRGLRIGHDALVLELPEAARDDWFARANAVLREAGAILAWRDETYRVVDPQTLRTLARFERAASRFWGTLTFGAHANGYLADAAGRVTHLWIAQRSPHKATDPGRLDNLVGGGVPHDQTPHEALVRECWEEAGLPEPLARHAVEAGVLELHRDIPEGLQHERLHAFDLALPPDWRPQNQDGEVAAFHCLPVAELLAREHWREMTLDAALVTLDFLRRRVPGALVGAGAEAGAEPA